MITVMTKEDAIRDFVARDLSGIPSDWVQVVAEKKGEEIYAWPMWGTMWICDFPGANRLLENARPMLQGIDELKDEVDQGKNSNFSQKHREKISKALLGDDWDVLGEYVDEEMGGAHCVLDTKGNRTAMYVYDIDGTIVLGVHGAGWDFYSGVWDKLYDILGLQWHTV